MQDQVRTSSAKQGQAGWSGAKRGQAGPNRDSIDLLIPIFWLDSTKNSLHFFTLVKEFVFNTIRKVNYMVLFWVMTLINFGLPSWLKFDSKSFWCVFFFYLKGTKILIALKGWDFLMRWQISLGKRRGVWIWWWWVPLYTPIHENTLHWIINLFDYLLIFFFTIKTLKEY